MKNEKQIYSSNHWKIGAAMITNDSTFTIGVFVVFMLFMGLSLSDVSIIISSYLIFSSIGQIPSGIFADRYGYKTSLIIGSLFFLGGTIFFAFAQNFYWFLVNLAIKSFAGLQLKPRTQHITVLLFPLRNKSEPEAIYTMYLALSI